MGLDVSHDAWSGAYSAFSRWRDALAKAAGYESARLVEHEDMPGKYGRMTVLIAARLAPVEALAAEMQRLAPTVTRENAHTVYWLARLRAALDADGAE